MPCSPRWVPPWQCWRGVRNPLPFNSSTMVQHLFIKVRRTVLTIGRAPHAHPSTLLLTTFVLALGESFDIACFGGMTGYQATRVEGGLAATVLS